MTPHRGSTPRMTAHTNLDGVRGRQVPRALVPHLFPPRGWRKQVPTALVLPRPTPPTFPARDINESHPPPKGAMTHVPQHNQFISFPWMEEIPDRLRSQLHWTHQAIPEDAPPRLVLLYTGKDDPGALDNMIHAMAPALSPYVLAYDNRRDGGTADQDLLAPNPYSYLCSLAYHGKVVLVGGGPNCRTWSILRWFPKRGAPVPVRVGQKLPFGASLDSNQPNPSMWMGTVF